MRYPHIFTKSLDIRIFFETKQIKIMISIKYKANHKVLKMIVLFVLYHPDFPYITNHIYPKFRKPVEESKHS